LPVLGVAERAAAQWQALERPMANSNERPGRNVGESLLETIGDSDIGNVATDLLEVTLDSFLKDGPLRDIPIVGALVGLYRGGVSVRDHLFQRKLMTFLLELNNVDASTRKRFVADLEVNPDLRRRVGEHVLLLLERLDDVTKAGLLAQVFAAHVERRISYADLCDLASGLDRLPVAHLADFQQVMLLANRLIPKFEERCAQLQNCGFLRQHSGTWGGGTRLGSFHITHPGRQFFEGILQVSDAQLLFGLADTLIHLETVHPPAAAKVLGLHEAKLFIANLDISSSRKPNVQAKQILGPDGSWAMTRTGPNEYSLVQGEVEKAL
jgi:hypothetical protein